MLIVIVITALSHLATALPQSSVADVPRFRYVLPEGFSGWACVDFGVEAAPALRRDQGIHVIEPENGSILRTSSFPGLTIPPFPSELIQIVNGSPRKVGFDEIQQRSEYDTKNPIARYCLFFGPAAAAAAVQRPPTLTESRLGTDPVLQHFEFSKGSLCDFRDASHVCVVAKDVSGRRVGNDIMRSLGDRITAVTDKCDAFDGIVVQYDADWSLQTHSSLADRARRPALSLCRRKGRCNPRAVRPHRADDA